MGIIVELKTFVIISSSKTIYVLDKKTTEVISLDISSKNSISKNEDTRELSSDEVVCLVSSKDEEYLAAATQNKRLIIWKISSWSFVREELLVKRPMAITFLPDSSKIIVADKNGDVYEFSLNEKNSNTKETIYCKDSKIDVEPGPEPLLGHLSMLLDLALTDDGKYLITCDRDEKIRVSSYPNCYNIHTFCLGHTEFISRLYLLPNQADCLLSASGDGRIILWNYLKGEVCAVLDLRLQIETLIKNHVSSQNASDDEKMMAFDSTFISNFDVHAIGSKKSIIAISFYGLPVLLFYEIDHAKESFSYLYSKTIPSAPIDLFFLKSGEILVFLDSSHIHKQNPFVMFRFSEDFSDILNIRDNFILNFGQEFREKLKTKTMWCLDVNSLYKHNKFDNVADYQKKKQERLNTNIIPRKRKSSEI